MPSTNGNPNVVRLRNDEISKLLELAKSQSTIRSKPVTTREILSEIIENSSFSISEKQIRLDLETLLMIEDLRNQISKLAFINSEILKVVINQNMGSVQTIKDQILKDAQ